MEEREIDLLDYLLRELRRWKLIILSALLCGVIMGCVGYFKNKRDYESQLADIELQYSSDIDEKISALEESMEENDIDIVRNHMEREGSYVFQEEYLEKSILMNLDPGHVRMARYIIAVKYKNKEADNFKRITDVTEEIAEIFNSDDFAGIIKDVFYPDSSVEYVREVVSGNSGNNVITESDVAPVVRVNIYIPDDADIGSCDTIIEDYLKNNSDIYSNEYNVEIISSIDDYAIDSALVTKQRDFYNTLDTYRSRVKTEVANYTDDQNKLIELIEAKEAVENGENEGLTKQEAIDELAAPGISKKFIALGLFLGMILVMGIDFVILALSSKVNTIADADTILMVRPMLVFYDRVKGGLGDSKKLYGMQYRKYKDADKQMENFTRELTGLLKDGESDGITIVMADVAGEQDNQYIERIRQSAVEAGVKITEQVLEFIGDIDVSSQLRGDAPLIVYVRQGSTRLKALEDIREMAHKNGRKLAGFVYVDC